MNLRTLQDKLIAHGDRGVQYHEGSRVEFRTFAALAADVERIAAALKRGGVTQGMCVGIMAHNSYEWVVYDLALLELRAIVVALPMEHFEQADRELLAERYGIRLLWLGPEAGDRSPGSWVHRMSVSDVPVFSLRAPAAKPPALSEDVLTLAFSSGTSGQVKCLIFSRAGTEAVIDTFGRDFQFRPNDWLLAFLPLSSIQQRWMLFAAIQYGFGMCLTIPSRLFHALRDFRPTIICSAPLLFETVEAGYLLRKGGLKAVIEVIRRCLAPLPLWLRVVLGRRIFRPVHAAFGGRVRFCVVGAAASRIPTLKFYESIGMPLYQGWGMTETGFQSWNLPGRNRIGSVGKAVYPGALQILSDGEIIVRHHLLPAVGYLDVPEEEARKTFVEPYCIATGDIGRIDQDGFLFIEGRKKEIIVSRGGYKVQPADLEREILNNELVGHAVVLGGDELHCIMAVIAPRGDRDSRTEARIREMIDTLNKRLPPPARIERVLFTDQRFTRENRLLNRNLKVDRKRVLERFKSDLLA